MATFRKYGGTNYSPISNIVRHNILNSKSSSFNTSGLYNSKETHLSHIDMSGNSLIHVGNIIFQDGTSISSSTDSNNGLAQVLTYGPSADGKSMTNVGSIEYVGGTTQTSAYTGYTTQGTYQYATLTLDPDGKITNIINNTTTTGGLEDVLGVSGDGGGKNMTNLGNITQSSGTNTLKATTFEEDITMNSNYINFSNNKQQNTSYTGWQPTVDTCYNSATLRIDTNGKIINIIDNSFSPFGLADVLTKSGDGGGKNMTNLGNITQSSGTTSLQATTFNGDITQSTGTNNTLKATTFEGDISQTNYKITQSGTGSNILNDTSFNGLCKYIGTVSINYDNDIPNKAYVDTIASGLKPTAFCDCATTGDIPLSGYLSLGPLEVDGYLVQNGNRVLVKSQGATSNNENTENVENGIYVYNESTGKLTRASDCDDGDNITNQYLFIENGDLNGLTAFIQTNEIADFQDGTSEPIYTRFYAQKFQTGQGLEFVSGTPTTLRVESSLNFLKGVTIINDTGNNGYLTFSDTHGSTKGSTNIRQNDEYLQFVNNTVTSVNYEKSFKFFCNNVGNDFKQTIPLQFNSSSFSVDLSNNAGGSPIRYEAFNNSSGIIGHNFTGNTYFNNRLVMNSTDAGNRYIQTSYIDYKTIFSDPSYGITQLYQGSGNLILHNTAYDRNDSRSRFSFLCNDVSVNSDIIPSNLSLANPIQFNTNYFNLSLLTKNNNGDLEYGVKYQACSKNYYSGLHIGHNFTGDCYIDGSGGTFNRHLTISQTSNFNNRIEYYTNLDSDTNYNGITKAGDNAIVSYNPLSIAHGGNGITSGIRIDISNVRLQASYANYYDLSLSTGHNFTGNCYFNNNILLNTLNSYMQFPNGSKQTNAPFGERNTYNITSNNSTITTDQMLSYGIFYVGGSITTINLTNISSIYQFAILNATGSFLTVYTNNNIIYNGSLSTDSAGLLPYQTRIFTSFFSGTFCIWCVV